MSWTDVDLSGVSLDMDLIPEGNYVLTLLPGAREGKWNAKKIELGGKIAEGEYTGRVVYWSYGDPDGTPSMKGAMKRLTIALAKSTGVEIEPGQHPIEYLNNEDVVGGKFIAQVLVREIPATEEREASNKNDIQIFKVKPVPEAK